MCCYQKNYTRYNAYYLIITMCPCEQMSLRNECLFPTSALCVYARVHTCIHTHACTHTPVFKGEKDLTTLGIIELKQRRPETSMEFLFCESHRGIDISIQAKINSHKLCVLIQVF